MLSRLSNTSDEPILIAADSTDEALAFLAQLLSDHGGEELASYRDRVLVFDKPGVLPRLAAGAQSFIPVVITRDVELELAPYAKSMQGIIVYPRNAASSEPHIVLEPANYETFNEALEGMGKDRDEIKRLANESGHSLTVLRRRLATVDAVRMPHWAGDHKTAISLVPFLFVGGGIVLPSLFGLRRPLVHLARESPRLKKGVLVSSDGRHVKPSGPVPESAGRLEGAPASFSGGRESPESGRR